MTSNSGDTNEALAKMYGQGWKTASEHRVPVNTLHSLRTAGLVEYKAVPGARSGQWRITTKGEVEHEKTAHG